MSADSEIRVVSTLRSLSSVSAVSHLLLDFVLHAPSAQHPSQSSSSSFLRDTIILISSPCFAQCTPLLNYQTSRSMRRAHHDHDPNEPMGQRSNIGIGHALKTKTSQPLSHLSQAQYRTWASICRIFVFLHLLHFSTISG